MKGVNSIDDPDLIREPLDFLRLRRDDDQTYHSLAGAFYRVQNSRTRDEDRYRWMTDDTNAFQKYVTLIYRPVTSGGGRVHVYAPGENLPYWYVRIYLEPMEWPEVKVAAANDGTMVAYTPRRIMNVVGVFDVFDQTEARVWEQIDKT